MIQFIMMIMASILSLAAGYVLAKKYNKLTIPLFFLGILILGVNIIPKEFPASLSFLFPGHPSLDYLYTGVFIASGVLAARYNKTILQGVLQGIMGLLLAYYLLFPAGYMAFHSEYIKNLNKGVKDGVTLQTTTFSCAPSSIATILRTYGLEYTEGELAYALQTTTMGTDDSHIPRVIREFGKPLNLKAEFVNTSLEQLREMKKPAVLFIYAGNMRHATALLGFDDDMVVLGEPYYGIRKINIKDFQEVTRWTRLATVISENPD